jgi:4-amino-4-deoxy-L-arabinose transferase-like glycosyltransferase
MKSHNKKIDFADNFLHTSKYSFYIVLFLIAVGVWRIVATYKVFSNTFDEPAHIACGLEWLDLGSYNYEAQHPPLARVADAIGPYMDGARIPEGSRSFLRMMSNKHAKDASLFREDIQKLKAAMWRDGKEILYNNHTYQRTLTLARMGALPFFIIASLIVWFWARRLFDNFTGIAAVTLFTTLPPVLAHSGLATTDMAITATFAAFLFVYTRWNDHPSLPQSIILGIVGAFTVLSKYTALLFIPASVFSVTLLKWISDHDTSESRIPFSRRHLTIVFSIVVGLLIIWGGFRFSLSSFTSRDLRPHKTIDRIIGSKGVLHDICTHIVEAPILPAIDFFGGIYEAIAHNERGHNDYLLGKRSTKGWWYFFLVALTVKTPVPFIIFTFIGVFFLLEQARQQKYRQAFEPVICAVGILIACVLVGNIDIGVRHVLPTYPLFAITAGFGAVGLWKVRHHVLLGRSIVIVLLLWQLTTSFLAHPDYLAYFNELAGRHPERILVDSDLDWGQDLNRLSKKLKELGIKKVAIAYFGWADLDQFGLPEFEPLLPNQKVNGWVAASITNIKKYPGYSWLEKYQPVTIVGKTIWLYNIKKK